MDGIWWNIQNFHGGSDSRESAYNARDLGFDAWVGKIPWRREWLLTPVFSPVEFQGQRSLVGYSLWGHKELDMTTWLTFLLSVLWEHLMEKEMATHSSVLAWRIPGMGEPCGLPSMGSHRVGHDWSDLAAAAAAIHPYSITPNCYHLYAWLFLLFTLYSLCSHTASS